MKCKQLYDGKIVFTVKFKLIIFKIFNTAEITNTKICIIMLKQFFSQQGYYTN